MICLKNKYFPCDGVDRLGVEAALVPEKSIIKHDLRLFARREILLSRDLSVHFLYTLQDIA